jgi:hypothetical protein
MEEGASSSKPSEKLMKDVSTLTAAEILAIPADQPEGLFTGDADAAKVEYRRLVSLWHPDQNPHVDERTMSHVNVLYNLAEFRIAADEWVTPGVVVFKTTDGKRFNLKYRSTRSFELGDIYVGDTVVAYSLFKDNEDLFKNAHRVVKNFKFENAKMEADIKKFLPEIVTEIETLDRLVVLYKKTPDQLLLSDVLDHFNGEVDPKHVAWMISRLYNLTCYLKYSGLVYAGITLDNCFVSPEFHSISLLGGWWYTTKAGENLTALPGLAVEFTPDDVLNKQKANPLIDLLLVKAAGRQLLGDVDGSKLLMKGIPMPLVTWLRGLSTGDAFKEYEIWQKQVLIDSFGPRKYVELKLTADDLYGAKK